MPLFEYACPDCNIIFEKLMAKPEPALNCPTCGKPALRVVSNFAAGHSGSPAGGGCSAPGGSGFS